MIDKQLSQKILTFGVSKSTYGGMTSVLVSYEKCFERMRFIPTWKLGNKFTKGWYAFQAIIRCFILLAFDRRIEILHIHGAANASFYRKELFIKIGKFFGKKIVFHQHAADFKEFYEQSNEKGEIVKTLNLSDRLIVLSESWKNFFASIGVAENKICILNNIVCSPQKEVIKRTDKKMHLLFLGEISFRKGIYDLLDMLKENKDFFEERIFLRVGGNLVDGNIDLYIAENGLSSFVQYEGWISGSKKIECLNWADLYILPSYNEGLPIAILEAMSYSHPIISTNVGGIPEVLHTHENGILIEPGNAEQIKAAVSFFVDYPQKIQEYGENAYIKVQPFFSDNVCKKLSEIYMQLL